jgi:hypothetical protein
MFKFNKRAELFVAMHNKAPAVVTPVLKLTVKKPPIPLPNAE